MNRKTEPKVEPLSLQIELITWKRKTPTFRMQNLGTLKMSFFPLFIMRGEA